MSVLIGKMVNLGLDDLAVKEIKILKRRLDQDCKPKKAGNAATAPQTLDELLDFGKGDFTGTTLALVITTQLQVLRILASSKRLRQIESALPFLEPSYPSSPSTLLLKAVKESSKPDKFIRQLQSLSEILLSLGPSVSPSDDAVSLEPRLNVAPEVAFQLQLLALRIRGLWWKLAGHKGDTTKDLSDPFLRCLSALARRGQCSPQNSYRIACHAFDQMQAVISDLGPALFGPKPVLVGIYRILGSIAQEASHINEAINWTRQIHALSDPKSDTEVKRTAVTARLVALILRRSSKDLKNRSGASLRRSTIFLLMYLPQGGLR
jgi:separase